MRASVRLVLALTLGVSGLITIGATAAAGGGCHAPTTKQSAAREAGEVQVAIGECQFSPTVLYVDPGTRVTWTNKELAQHTVTGALLSWGSYDALRQGQSVSYRFDEEGIYPYQCFFHPGMSAAVVVGDVNELKAGIAPIAAAAPDIEPVAAPEAGAPVDLDLKKDDSANLPGLSLSAAALLLGAGALVRSRRNNT